MESAGNGWRVPIVDGESGFSTLDPVKHQGDQSKVPFLHSTRRIQ